MAAAPKVRIAVFHGDRQHHPQLASEAREWLKMIDRTTIDDANKPATAANYFDGCASRWFSSYEADYPTATRTWAHMKTKFLDRFAPSASIGSKLLLLSNLQQGSDEEVLGLFDRIRSNWSELDRDLEALRPDWSPAGGEANVHAGKDLWVEARKIIGSYIRQMLLGANLATPIRLEVIKSGPTTLDEMLSSAQRAEESLRMTRSTTYQQPPPQKRETMAISMPSTSRGQGGSRGFGRGRGSFRGANSNWSNFRGNQTRGQGGGGRGRGRPAPGSGSRPPTQCFYCGSRSGHWQQECPSRLRDNAPLKTAREFKDHARKMSINVVELSRSHQQWQGEGFTYDDSLQHEENKAAASDQQDAEQDVGSVSTGFTHEDFQ